MDNFRKNMYLGKSVFGQIGVPKANVIRMVQIFVFTQTMNFEQNFMCTCVFDLKIPVRQGEVVKVQMGSCDRSDIHGDRDNLNSVLVDFNLAV